MGQQGRTMRQAMTALKEQTVVMKATAQEAFAVAAAEREAAEAALSRANTELATERSSASDLQVWLVARHSLPGWLARLVLRPVVCPLAPGG